MIYATYHLYCDAEDHPSGLEPCEKVLHRIPSGNGGTEFAHNQGWRRFYKHPTDQTLSEWLCPACQKKVRNDDTQPVLS